MKLVYTISDIMIAASTGYRLWFEHNKADLGVYYAPPYFTPPGQFGGPPTSGGPPSGGTTRPSSFSEQSPNYPGFDKRKRKIGIYFLLTRFGLKMIQIGKSV